MSGVVVVGVDASASARKAAEVALDLAESLGASLHVVTGFESESAETFGSGSDQVTVFRGDSAQHVAESLGASRPGVEVTHFASRGKPARLAHQGSHPPECPADRGGQPQDARHRPAPGQRGQQRGAQRPVRCIHRKHLRGLRHFPHNVKRTTAEIPAVVRFRFPAGQARYSSSVTWSSQVTTCPFPSASCMATCAMNRSGVAPCQCSSPGSM
ncbi:hypothetical protein QE394_002548 [Arthrobacter sp. SORGH_AS 212]|nr:hypothetical protein [Arthrobacter sp. SORGH_AS_0212]